jgi:REP element-mobilizing transposase RayT
MEGEIMRKPRILGPGASFYHVMSRVVDRQFILDKRQRRCFCKLMRKLATFTGLRIITHSILSNHFHILLHVPRPIPIDDAELERRLCALYENKEGHRRMKEIRRHEQEGRPEIARQMREGYIARMYDLSTFVKELKQRFTQQYNREHNRRGTLWEERFKSVLVEGSGNPLQTIAAYIDLNAVRAGLCNDPADYPDCGYGEAVAGNPDARAGLEELMALFGPAGTWDQAQTRYRRLLIIPEGETPIPGGKPRPVAPAELDLPHILRIRIRYFTDGVVFGGRQFVEDIFQLCRSHFGTRPRTGARPMQGKAWENCYVIRDLRGDVYGATA